MSSPAASGAEMDVPLVTRPNEAKTLKTLGDDQYGQKKYAVAVTHYTDALAQLPPRPSDDAPEDKPVREESNAIEEVDDVEAEEIKKELEQKQSISLEDHLVFEEVGQLRVKLCANLAAAQLKLVRTVDVLCRNTMKVPSKRVHRVSFSLMKYYAKSLKTLRHYIVVLSHTKNSVDGHT